LLFSKSGRLSAGAPGEGQGLGLGLYLSRDIIHKHGGDLWYEAKDDGSNFVVMLPHV
jgi:signal transduction histidine kinase